MGDSLARSDPPDYNPNGCDHAYEDVEGQEFELTDPHGNVVLTREYTVCTQCGYVLEQPGDMPEIDCIGGWASQYPDS